MKKYIVENRRNYNEIFDNYVGDYINADSEKEAIELAKQYFIDNGSDVEEVESFDYIVKEYCRV